MSIDIPTGRQDALDFVEPFGNSAPVTKASAASNELLTSVLEQVSRSFYLTLRILPASIRSQIGLAYLLARTTDTIADTEIVPLEQRVERLEQLRRRILGTSTEPLDFAELARNQGAQAERTILERVEESLSLLADCDSGDQELIRRVLDTITGGQLLDLERFAGATAARIVALKLDSELDDYTYRVAGCVGEFWTKICLKNQFREADFLKRSGKSEGEFESLGIRFGKGLQLVNILRDLPVDLRNGRCYVPEETLAPVSLHPENLLEPQNEQPFRPAYNRLLDRAEGHLSAGWEYTNLIPRSQVRLRLACALPILIGFQTLAQLRNNNVLDPNRRIKISRNAVKKIIGRAVLMYPFPGWRDLPSKA